MTKQKGYPFPYKKKKTTKDSKPASSIVAELQLIPLVHVARLLIKSRLQ